MVDKYKKQLNKSRDGRAKKYTNKSTVCTKIMIFLFFKFLVLTCNHFRCMFLASIDRKFAGDYEYVI